ncbi:MAG: carboxypeptidase regulatory-like domain-containing protein [Cyanobacteriota bacterium]|nr:carboxypeptidase regulatory-like domain-containing protein [Cyanobacteriota bacterium]
MLSNRASFWSLYPVGKVSKSLWIGIGLWSCLWAQASFGHGVKIEYHVTQAIEIQADYDTGEPMQQGQVTVYSPLDPAKAWLKGETDERGRFVFRPDPTLEGIWEVKVRQAGHGDIATFPVQAGSLGDSQGSTSGLSPRQTGLMAGSILWGLLGTTLFFARKSHAH